MSYFLLYPAYLIQRPGGIVVQFPDIPDLEIPVLVNADAAYSAAEIALTEYLDGIETRPEPSIALDFLKAPKPDGCVGCIMIKFVPQVSSGVRVNVYLPSELLERAERFASRQGIKRSQLIAIALRAYLETPNVD